ncbi:MAG: hypothetical protein HC822_15945 [Oscillochloris sp.]|nr:hypothetical protein [Oscillochloris sp.]
MSTFTAVCATMPAAAIPNNTAIGKVTPLPLVTMPRAASIPITIPTLSPVERSFESDPRTRAS